MQYVLALDQGTTSSRAIVFDDSGRVVGMAGQEFSQIFPQPGWVEHNPNEIWHSQQAVLHEVLSTTTIAPRDIAAIGITNQRETTIVWDKKTGEPLYNAIVWQDRRTADICTQLKAEGLAPLFQQKTGLVLDAYFSGTKLKWLLDHIPNLREQATRGEVAFGTVDSWLLWKLTGGVHATDPSNASRTLLYNIHSRAWDSELLDILGIPPQMLPEVKTSSEIYGYTQKSLLSAEIPIAGMAGDQQAATFGQVCLRSGMAKNTYGTGCFMLMNTGYQAITSKNKLLTTIGWQLAERTTYCLEGSVFMAGASVQWLRDGLGIIAHSGEVEALAASVPDNGGVYVVPAFVGLGAPYWDSYARGSILGMSRGSHKAHIARAVLESIAYQSADVLHAMQKDSQTPLTELRVDGGASQNNMLMQFQADILGVPVVRPQITETTALGAAYLAGLAVGVWNNVQDIASQWQVDRRFEPHMPQQQREDLLAQWHKAVERSKNWVDV